MKRLLSVFLAITLFTLGMIGCDSKDKKSSENSSAAGNTIFVPTLLSYEENSIYDGDKKSTENGAYNIEIGDNQVIITLSSEYKNERYPENNNSGYSKFIIDLDDQKRPCFVKAEQADSDEVYNIEISYSGKEITVTNYPVSNPDEKRINIYTVDDSWQIIKQETSSGNLMEYTYDKNGNPLTTSQNGEITQKYEYEYDINGNPVFAKLYNSEGKQTKQIRYSYYPNGNLMWEISVDANGEYVGTSLHPYKTFDVISLMRGHGAAVAAGVTYEQTFNQDGYITSVERKNIINHETATAYFEYDDSSRLIKYVGFNGTVETYKYDEENRLVEFKRGSNTTSYSYDSQGRLVSEQRTDNGKLMEKNETVYDKNGYISSQKNWSEYTYDGKTNTSNETYKAEYTALEQKSINENTLLFFMKALDFN